MEGDVTGPSHAPEARVFPFACISNRAWPISFETGIDNKAIES